MGKGGGRERGGLAGRKDGGRKEGISRSAACGRRGLVEISCAQAQLIKGPTKDCGNLTLTLHDRSVHAAPKNICDVLTP